MAAGIFVLVSTLIALGFGMAIIFNVHSRIKNSSELSK